MSRWVLAPGTLCTQSVFEPVMEQLGVPTEERCPVSVDAPTVGDYSTRLARLIAPGSIACGFSLGALVLAHNLAALHAARAVVLLSLNPLADVPDAAPFRKQARDRVLAGDARNWVFENWDRMSEFGDSAMLETVADMAEQASPLIEAQTALALSRPSAVEALVATEMPLVFVTGAQDKMTPPGPVVDIVRRAGRASVQILDGLGHFALLEAPDRVAEAIERGLREIQRGI